MFTVATNADNFPALVVGVQVCNQLLGLLLYLLGLVLFHGVYIQIHVSSTAGEAVPGVGSG